MKLIILATDGSESAERAIVAAAELAKSSNAKLLIVHVSEDKFSDKQRFLLEQLQVTEGDALEEFSRWVLSRAKSLAENHGALNIETAAAGGDPAKVLMEIAEREHADAIAVGRRGLGQLQGLLLGSVSRKLACLAPCAVIVVP